MPKLHCLSSHSLFISAFLAKNSVASEPPAEAKWRQRRGIDTIIRWLNPSPSSIGVMKMAPQLRAAIIKDTGRRIVKWFESFVIVIGCANYLDTDTHDMLPVLTGHWRELHSGWLGLSVCHTPAKIRDGFSGIKPSWSDVISRCSLSCNLICQNFRRVKQLNCSDVPNSKSVLTFHGFHYKSAFILDIQTRKQLLAAAKGPRRRQRKSGLHL